MESKEIARRGSRAHEVGETLAARGVRAVAITIVDNTGVARVKAVPLPLLERSARQGIGLSPVFDVFLVNDHITASADVGGPVGDLRLMLDPSALRILSAQPGWAWAPADQYTQEGEIYPVCQRSFLRRMVDRAGDLGLDLQVGCEVEFFLGREGEGGTLEAAHNGPGYSAKVLTELSDFCRDLIVAFEEQGVGVDQFHPEYATGQLEISLPARSPVASADLAVLVRQTIRGVAIRHGWRPSFSPVVVPGEVGNGGHIHLSVWQEGRNLFAGGEGPHGMTETGESFMAGILDELPALVAVGAPSVASYLRLIPLHWAGVYRCWGRENREAGLRFVTGMVGTRESAANCEVKCFDQSANPYLALGAVLAAGLAGIADGRRLPPEYTDDPGMHSDEELAAAGVERLPTSLDESLERLEGSDVIREAMGTMLFEAFVAVRRAEFEAFGSLEPDEVAAIHRWRY
jgi:glutamine synthetase